MKQIFSLSILSILSILAATSPAQSPTIWQIEYDGWNYGVRAATIEEAVAIARQRHREAGREAYQPVPYAPVQFSPVQFTPIQVYTQPVQQVYKFAVPTAFPVCRTNT